MTTPIVVAARSAVKELFFFDCRFYFPSGSRDHPPNILLIYLPELGRRGNIYLAGIPGAVPNKLEVAGLSHRSRKSRLHGAHHVVHLARRYIVEVEGWVVVCPSSQFLVEPNHGLAEQDLLIGLGPAVRVQFDEEPVRLL